MASRHLLNPLAPLDQRTPSALDGVPPQFERDLRACEWLSGHTECAVSARLTGRRAVGRAKQTER